MNTGKTHVLAYFALCVNPTGHWRSLRFFVFDTVFLHLRSTIELWLVL